MIRRLLLAAAFGALSLPALAGPGGLPKTKMPPPPEDSPAAATNPASAPASEAGDPYIWLEDVRGPRSMAWVEAHNARTVAALETDSRYAGFYGEALALSQDKDRIPAPRFIGGELYNFWQDADHVRGLWRTATVQDYANPQPNWRTLVDLDALAKAENANWVWKGADCEQPQDRLCLVNLSDGGEDAVTAREFDLSTPGFAAAGFDLPRGKQRFDWEDENTLLVSREWAPGQLTASGYPFVVKRLRRGEPLAQAVEVFHGSASDGGYGVTPEVLHDGQGHKAELITRPLSTFEVEQYLLTPTTAPTFWPRAFSPRRRSGSWTPARPRRRSG